MESNVQYSLTSQNDEEDLTIAFNILETHTTEFPMDKNPMASIPQRKNDYIQEKRPTKKKLTKAQACRKYREQKKESKQDLHKRKLELEENIYEMKILRGLNSNSMISCSKWEAEAVEQRFQTQASIRRNKELKQAIAAQMKFNENLRKMIQKQPPLSYSLSEFVAEEWRGFRLPIDPMERIRTMHSIADAQMDLLSNALLRADLYHTSNENLIRDRCIKENGKITSIEIARNGVFKHIDPSSLAFVTQQFWAGKIYSSEDFCSRRAVEIVDNNLFYLEHVYPHYKPPKIKRSVFKRYDLTNRTVVVWKTIQEDPLNITQDPLSIDESGWMVFEPLGKNNGCVKKTLLQIKSPIFWHAGIQMMIPMIFQGIANTISSIDDMTEYLSRNPGKNFNSCSFIESNKAFRLIGSNLQSCNSC